MAVLRSRKQRGSGAAGAPLSYINSRHVEPSASAGSNLQISEPGLVRPVLNPTGGKRSYSKRRSYKRRSYKRSYRRSHRRSHKQRGSGAMGAPFSYVNSKYSEASASAGSDIQISEPGLVRPVLNPTGGAAAPPIASSASPVLVMPPPAPPPPVCAPAPPVPCTPPPPPPTPPPPPMPQPSVSDSACPCSGKPPLTTGGMRSRRGGFYPSVMGQFVGNASRLVPAAAITGYRMVKNYNKTRRTRK